MDSEIQSAAENYFLQTNFSNRRVLQDIIHVRESYESAWNVLSEQEKEQAINDEIILPEVLLKHNSYKPEIKSFPRLRIKTGQKIVEDEDIKTGEKIKYRDEHSAPFSWKTRSQQDLTLNLSMSSSEVDTEGLDVVAARRSAILSCPFGQYSRIPKSAKPVPIPVVPPVLNKNTRKDAAELTKDENRASDSMLLVDIQRSEVNLLGDADVQEDSVDRLQPDSLAEVTSMASSIVISKDDNLILDFSKPLLESSESTLSTGSSTPREDTSLLGRMKEMKEKTMSLKRSLTPTLRRKKSTASIETGSTTVWDTGSALSSDGELTPTKTYVKVTRAVSCNRPSAPPPPPPPTAAPSSASKSATMPNSSKHGGSHQSIGKKSSPPPPPARDPQTRISSRPATPEVATTCKTPEVSTACKPSEVTEKPAADDEIPKTGFDFLDNW